jgi:hypothetical protein
LRIRRVGTPRSNVWSEDRRELGSRLLPFATHYSIQSNNPETHSVAFQPQSRESGDLPSPTACAMIN